MTHVAWKQLQESFVSKFELCRLQGSLWGFVVEHLETFAKIWFKFWEKTVSLHSAVLSDSQFDQNILSCKEPLPGVSFFLVGRQAGRQAGSVHEHNFGHKSRGGSRLISSYFCFLCCHILLHIFVCVYLICATSVAPLALNCCEQTCRRTWSVAVAATKPPPTAAHPAHPVDDQAYANSSTCPPKGMILYRPHPLRCISVYI